MQHSCSHYNAICNHRFKKRIDLRTQEEPLVAEHRGGTKTTAAATAAHTRYLSSPAEATLHGKTQGFALRLPPQNKTHATCMQSMRFAASRSKPAGIYAHGNTTWQQSYAAITQASYRLVMWCQVSHHSLTPPFIECIVMWCKVTSPFIECIATWCKVSHHPSLSVLLRDAKSQTTVSHHPSLSVLLCDVKSHATLHWVYCCVMQSFTPPFIECIVLWCKVTPPFIECIVVWCKVSHHPSLNVLLCDVKSHHPSLSVLLCDVKSPHPSLSVLLRDVKSHTTLRWVYCYVMPSLKPQSHTTLHWVYCSVM